MTVAELHDTGLSAAEIAERLTMPLSTVYSHLRRDRPARRRKPRDRKSEKRAMVLGLHAAGVAPMRIAFLQQVSKQYVYRVLAEVTPGPPPY